MQLMSLYTAYKHIHFPDSRKEQKLAQIRIFFDRLLKVQLHAKLFKQSYQANAVEETEDLIQVTKKSKNTTEKPKQTELVTAKKQQKTQTTRPDVYQPQRETVKEITATLPFELTGAQKRVIKEMLEDIHLPKPMLRLLQGDVGSGKTVVAAVVAYYVIKVFKGQVAFLAPLSILAQQHYQNLAKLLLPLGIRIEYIA